MGFGNATKYEVTHLKRGKTLNVRDTPNIGKSAVVGKLSSFTTNISIKECMELKSGREWCYISVPRGGSHLEGWVSSYYLAPMSKTSQFSRLHIQNFLQNFYMADEENFLDKLQVFYKFPMQKYFYRKNLSLMELRQNKVREYKKWSKRNYHFTYMKILKRKPNYIDVQTTVRWKFKGHNDSESGKDIQKIRLVPSGNTFKVLAIKNLRHTVFPKPVVQDENMTAVAQADINQTTVASAPVSTSISSSKYYIKAGSFFLKINSDYLQSIHNHGYSYLVQKVTQGKKVMHRVFIGPFNSEEEAKEALLVVRAKINEYAYIQKNISH